MNPLSSQRRVRVLLADDHGVVRQGFRLLLARYPDIEVIAEASNGREALDLCVQLAPDVVILDVAMPEMNGVEATRLIRQNCPTTNVLVLTMHKDAIYLRECLRAGARGYLLKDSIDKDLIDAVRAVARGEGFLSPAVSATVLDDYQKHVTNPLDLITGRERQVLQMLAQGKTSKDIASELNISVYTVDAHRSRILKKLGLRSIGDLVRFAMQNGLA
ncbi:MAG: response regulator transcription factor [Acidobacteria bacterium]|nr:response regulator transcription factor [Acidobacteriota bacterium]